MYVCLRHLKKGHIVKIAWTQCAPNISGPSSCLKADLHKRKKFAANFFAANLMVEACADVINFQIQLEIS